MVIDNSLDNFINRFAKKIVILYPSNCADAEDYIQTGYLKLAEIDSKNLEQQDLKAYAIISIARAMRKAALNAMCAVTAPEKIKKLIHMIDLLTSQNNTDKEIQDSLDIDSPTLSCLRSLIDSRSFDDLYAEPKYENQPFSEINDILSSCLLSEKDKQFLEYEINDDQAKNLMTRKQKWIAKRKIRDKITRSGYGL